MNALDLARQTLLEPGGLTDNDLQRGLDMLLAPGLDAADLYFQSRRNQGWSLEDGLIKNGSFSIEQGVGLRGLRGEAAGLAYTEELTPMALTQAATTAAALARDGRGARPQPVARRDVTPLYRADDPISSLPDEDKIAALRQADTAARAADAAVIQVNASIAASHQHVLIAMSDGTLAADVRPMVRFNVSVVVERNGKRESAHSGGGGRYGLDEMLRRINPAEVAREAVRLALLRLEADPAPAGTFPVVLGPGWPGVLLHEAVGHGLEGDFNRKGSSVYAGRVGELVASPLVTLVDDGSIPDRRGSLSIDDEGVPGQRNVLIEKGILKGYMQDKLNARLSGVAATGNGRRESFAHLPMPRMTNTFMESGEHDPDEIIASVDNGIYAKNFEGGQVDITSGNFVFTAAEAYRIENGRITRPLKGMTLIGNGPKTLEQISMVGNDLELDPGIGVCGKDGQSVPVGVGQPTLKVDGLTIGGTA
ncbi:MAG: metalloprotease TldD [Oceanococcaceae bacterium]